MSAQGNYKGSNIRDIQGANVGSIHSIQGHNIGSLVQNFGPPQGVTDLAEEFLETLYDDDAQRRRMYKVSKNHEKTFAWIVSDQFDDKKRLSFDDKLQVLREELRMSQAKFDEYWKSVPWSIKNSCRPENDKQDCPSLMNWANDGQGIFWIWGKPGCGKSTLMKHLWKNVAYMKAIGVHVTTSPAIAAQHFFWRAGSGAQRSELVFWASILHQFLSNDRLDLIDSAFAPVRQKSAVRKWKRSRQEGPQSVWIVEELLEAIDSLFENNPHESFYLHIDGLDECEGDGKNLATILKDLEKYPNVKMLISGRRVTSHWACFNHVPTIPMHLITWQDTARFVICKCTQNPAFNMLPDLPSPTNDEPLSKKDLMLSIIARSEGVLLWTTITIDEVIRRAELHQSLEQINNFISRAPRDIFALYESLLESLPPDHLAQASFWLLLASQKLVSADSMLYASPRFDFMKVAVFHFAELYDLDDPLWLCGTNAYDPQKLEEVLKNTSVKMERRCPHFFSIEEERLDYKSWEETSVPRTQQGAWRITLMHRTVADFVLETSILEKLRALSNFTDHLQLRLISAVIFAQTIFEETRFPQAPYTGLGDKLLTSLFLYCRRFLYATETLAIARQLYHKYLQAPIKTAGVTWGDHFDSGWRWNPVTPKVLEYHFDTPRRVSDSVLALCPFIWTRNFELALCLSRELKINFSKAERYWILAIAMWAGNVFPNIFSFPLWNQSYVPSKLDAWEILEPESNLRLLVSELFGTSCIQNPDSWMDIHLLQVRNHAAFQRPTYLEWQGSKESLSVVSGLLLESGSVLHKKATVDMSGASCETTRLSLLSLVRQTHMTHVMVMCDFHENALKNSSPETTTWINSLIQNGGSSRVIRKRRWSFPMVEQSKAFTEDPHFDSCGAASISAIAMRRAEGKVNVPICKSDDDDLEHALDCFRQGRVHWRQVYEEESQSLLSPTIRPAVYERRPRRDSLSAIKAGGHLERCCEAPGRHSDWKELQHVLLQSGFWKRRENVLTRSTSVLLSEYASFVSSSSYLRFQARSPYPEDPECFEDLFEPWPSPQERAYVSFCLARNQLRMQGDFFPEPKGRFSGLFPHLTETTPRDRAFPVRSRESDATIAGIENRILYGRKPWRHIVTEQFFKDNPGFYST